MTEKEYSELYFKYEVLVRLLQETAETIDVSHPLLAAYILEQLQTFDVYLDEGGYE